MLSFSAVLSRSGSAKAKRDLVFERDCMYTFMCTLSLSVTSDLDGAAARRRRVDGADYLDSLASLAAADGVATFAGHAVQERAAPTTTSQRH